MGAQALATVNYGFLPPNTIGLILGRSSTTVQNLQVYPGITDNDYTGEIKIMAKAINGIVTTPAEKRTAQLILLPLLQTNNPHKGQKRGDKGFGSSDAYWVQSISPKNCY